MFPEVFQEDQAAKVALELAPSKMMDLSPCLLALKTIFCKNCGGRLDGAALASPWPWDHEHIGD